MCESGVSYYIVVLVLRKVINNVLYLSLGNAAWAHGNSLVNYMKMVEFIGLSGPIKFDASGLRTQFAMDLMELQMPGLVKHSTHIYISYFNFPFPRPKLVHGIVLINLTLQE